MDPEEYRLMDAAEASMWWYRALHTRLAGALDKTSGQVLDAGCGTGGFLTTLTTARPDLALHGLEYNAIAASRARAKSGAVITRGSINAMPYATARFDAAVSADVLCHAAVDPALGLAEIHRVLRPGGRVILNLPAYPWLLSAHDRRVQNARRFTAASIRDLLQQSGFRDIQTHYWNGLLLPLMILQRKVMARGESVSDVAPFPPWLNAIFHAMTQLERRLPFAPPAGGSVLATAEKP